MRSTQQENPTTYVIANNNFNKLNHLSDLRQFLGTVFRDVCFLQKVATTSFLLHVLLIREKKKAFDQLSSLINLLSVAHLHISL